MDYANCNQYLELFFVIMSNARATANCSFSRITHVSEKISRCCAQSRKVKYRLQIVH